MDAKVYEMVYGGKTMKVSFEIGFTSPTDKTVVKGTIKVMDNGEGKKGRGLFFVWDTKKYKKPCLYDGKKPLFGKLAEYDKDFVVWVLKEFSKIRKASKASGCDDCPIDCTGAKCYRLSEVAV